MKGFLIILAIVIVAAVTNPSQERHAQVVSSKLRTMLMDEYKSERSRFFGFITDIIYPGAIEIALGTLVSGVNYHNCIVFSYTTYEGERLSIGAFGQVFPTFD